MRRWLEILKENKFSGKWIAQWKVIGINSENAIMEKAEQGLERWRGTRQHSGEEAERQKHEAHSRDAG